MTDGAYLEVSLTNSGQAKLARFSDWDVIVQYYDEDGNYYVEWLPYTEETLEYNEWEVTGIYRDESPETFEPDILNPGEEIRIRARFEPLVGASYTNLVVISTPNGIPASAAFTAPD